MTTNHRSSRKIRYAPAWPVLAGALGLLAILASLLLTAPPAGAQNLVPVTVSFTQAEYHVAEGDSQQITINLSADPQRTVVIPITVEGFDGVTSDDYTVPDSVTFNSGVMSQTITFTAIDDTVDDDDEGVALDLGPNLPAGMTAGTQYYTDVYIDDDDIPESLTVSFSYRHDIVKEGGTTGIGLQLSDVPEREIVIPIAVTNLGGVTSADYSPVPSSVTFGANDRSKSFEFTATEDSDDDGEAVRFSIGAPLPSGVSSTTPDEIIISIVDGGIVTVGLAQVGVGVTAHINHHLIFDESGTGTITNQTWQWQRSATQFGTYTDIPAADGGTLNPYVPKAGDEGMWLKAKVTYDVTWLAEAFTSLTEDVVLTAQTAQAVTQQPVLWKVAVSNAGFSNFDDEGLSFAVVEPGVTHLYAQGFTTGPDPRGYVLVGVRVSLYERSGTAAGTWAVHADDAGKPASAPILTGLPLPRIDSAADSFEELTIPAGLRLQSGARYWIVIAQTSPTEDGYIAVSAWTRSGGVFKGFELSGVLSADPSIPYDYLTNSVNVSPVDQGSEDGWSLDLDALSWRPDDSDDHTFLFPELLPWVLLSQNIVFPEAMPLRMSVLVAPEVTVQFGASDHTAAEGGIASVDVELSGDPRRTITIPITATGENGATIDDYSVPSSVTFNAGETSKTLTLDAIQDTLDDDDERVRLALGTMPDDYVTAGTQNETTVAITDDDHPELTVEYGQDSQLLAEGETVNVTFRLSAAPEREVSIPITATGQGGATSADYDAPTSVTFAEDETEKTIAFMAVNDETDDDDESVKLGFGTSLPERITAGARHEMTLNIGDNDNPIITVIFAQTAYTVAEGEATQVSVSADPERTIIIPITGTPQGTASAADYTVMPSATFHSGGTTPQTFTIGATQDLIDDDEMVTLGFGTMPDPRVSAGTPGTTAVTIEDDDTAGILLSPASLTVEEGESADYTVSLATEPSVDVTVTITTDEGSDLSVLEDTLTFTADDWTTPQTVTVSSAHDEDWEDDTDILTHTGGVAEYQGVEAGLPVAIDDNTGDLRLVDGVMTDENGEPCEGRLEFYYRGRGDRLRRLLDRGRRERGLPAAGLRRRHGGVLGLLSEQALPSGR